MSMWIPVDEAFMSERLARHELRPRFPPLAAQTSDALNDAQRAQAALVTVLQPTSSSHSPTSQLVAAIASEHSSTLRPTLSPSSSSAPTTSPSVLKIVLPSTQPHTSPQIRRIPLSPHVTLTQLMASVVSVCQLTDPFLLRWDGATGESLLLKRDEQLRAVMDEHGRSSGGSGGGGGVFKLHVVHKSRRTSRSSMESPATSPLASPSPAASVMSASLPSLDDSTVRSADSTSQQPKQPTSLSSSTYQPSSSTQPLSESSTTSASNEVRKSDDEEKSQATSTVGAEKSSSPRFVSTSRDSDGNLICVPVASTDKEAATSNGCSTCSPLLRQLTEQLSQLSTQVTAAHAAPTAAPPASCYSETALLTLTVMVESLSTKVESLSTQLQEVEQQRKEAQKRSEERRAERQARQSERRAAKEEKKQVRAQVREQKRSERKVERKAERETRKLSRQQEKKEQETERRQREAERTERTEQPNPTQQPQQQQQVVVAEPQAEVEGEVETDDMFAAVDSHPPSPALSATSAPSFGSSLRSSGRSGLGDESPSLSEEELDVLAPMLESARPLSPSSSAYLLCPPPSSSSSASAASPSASAVGSRLDDMLERLETEGYGVRSLNALVVSEHGGEDADWDVVVRDLELYYAQG